ncbi:MAG TPA: cupin domain-containing protein [Acidimicrobiales bacterium]|nr:cupin domain-containing protein [Acidimicrobiales bacterium]
MDHQAFDLTKTFVHLGRGSRAIPLSDFEWTEDYLTRYEADTADDGGDGRLVMISTSRASWTSWERHPAGEELVALLSGRVTLVQEVDGEERRTDLENGQAIINPTGVWHTADVHELSQFLFITPGRGTEHKPR